MTWTEGDTTWISGRPDWAPPWEQIELGHAETLDSMRNAPSSEHGFTQFWAWEDKAYRRHVGWVKAGGWVVAVRPVPVACHLAAKERGAADAIWTVAGWRR